MFFLLPLLILLALIDLLVYINVSCYCESLPKSDREREKDPVPVLLRDCQEIVQCHVLRFCFDSVMVPLNKQNRRESLYFCFEGRFCLSVALLLESFARF